VRVFVPAFGPSVQLPTVATPLPLVVWFPPVIDPPPLATANVTRTPDTGAPLASVTFTEGDVVSVVPGGAVWLFPPSIATAVGGGVAVAVNVTGLPESPAHVAVSEFPPVVAPSVQLPTAATPLAFVI